MTNCIYCVYTVSKQADTNRRESVSMLLTLTDLSSEPLQRQMSRQLRALILTGHLAAGEAIPSIRAMAREQRISVITVQRAYEELEREGLIASRRGKGFFVNELKAEKRLLIASERAREAMRKVLRVAISDGLTHDQIHHLLDQILADEGKGKEDETLF